MKVLIVNTSEQTGGAAIAARRLTESLRTAGVDARLLVMHRESRSPLVTALKGKWRKRLAFLRERLVIWACNLLSRRNLFAVSIANTGFDITRLAEFRQAGVIHLHWTQQGMLSLAGLRRILQSGKPVVWTLHDMWPVTGICHYARDCRRYETHCHHCPYLHGGGGSADLSARTFARKQRLLQGGHRISFVACSRWLAGLARQSALTAGQRVTSIPNPLPAATFHPGSRSEARQRCGLPPERQLILFGSVKITDKRKGIDYLVEACRLMDCQDPTFKDRLGIVVAGSGAEELAPLLPFEVYPMGYVADERRMADIYRAADLFAIPSLEDNLPNTIMEAMACGTPCVGFRTGGIPEMIDHLVNGYVAHYRDAADLAHGIVHTLTAPGYESRCAEAVQKTARCYAEELVARQYIQTYNQAIKDSDHAQP